MGTSLQNPRGLVVPVRETERMRGVFQFQEGMYASFRKGFSPILRSTCQKPHREGGLPLQVLVMVKNSLRIFVRWR